MKKRFWLFAAAALLLLAGCGAAEQPGSTYRQITQEEATKMMQ